MRKNKPVDIHFVAPGGMGSDKHQQNLDIYDQPEIESFNSDRLGSVEQLEDSLKLNLMSWGIVHWCMNVI